MIVFLDRLQAGLRAALGKVTAAPIVWSPSQLPSEGVTSFAVLRLLSGPDFDGAVPETAQVRRLPQTVLLTFTATDDARVYIGCTSAYWAYDVDPDDTAEDVRDAVLALLTADGHSVGASAVAVGTDSIRLTTLFPWGLYGLRVLGPVTAVVESEGQYDVATCPVLVEVEIQTFSKSRYPRSGAGALMATLVNGLYRLPVIETLDSYGLAQAGLPDAPADLTALADPDWESRSATQVQFSMRSFGADPGETIETIHVTATLNDGDANPITAEFTAE
jgi:hypothetical protein